MKTIQCNVDLLQAQQKDNAYQPKFLVETLPVLMHMSICEAIDRVTGDDYKKKLLDFENSKIREIHSYQVKTAGPKCIYLMHNKLQTYLKFFKASDKGLLPFVYGKDVYDNMQYDDFSTVNVQKQKEMNDRFLLFQDQEQVYKQSYNQAMKDKELQSLVVLEHAMKRLTESQINQLRSHVHFMRIKVKKNFDDVVIEPPKGVVQQIVRDKSEDLEDKEEESIIRNLEPDTEPIQIPDKIFIFERETLKPYQRLELKFQSLFQTAYKDFKRFKQFEISNFSKMTEMSMQLSQDIDIVKSVVSNSQSLFDDFEEQLTTRTDKMRQQLDDLANESGRQGKKLSRFDKEVEKASSAAEMADGRSENASYLVLKCQKRIEAIENELEEQRQMIAENAKNVQLELQSQIQNGQLQTPKPEQNALGNSIKMSGALRETLKAGVQNLMNKKSNNRVNLSDTRQSNSKKQTGTGAGDRLKFKSNQQLTNAEKDIAGANKAAAEGKLADSKPKGNEDQQLLNPYLIDTEQNIEEKESESLQSRQGSINDDDAYDRQGSLSNKSNRLIKTQKLQVNTNLVQVEESGKDGPATKTPSLKKATTKSNSIERPDLQKANQTPRELGSQRTQMRHHTKSPPGTVMKQAAACTKVKKPESKNEALTAKQIKFEEIQKKKAEIEKRKKEREEKQEKDRQELEVIMLIKQEEREQQDKQQAQQVEKELKQKLRADLIALMSKQSKCVGLTKSFLIDLGDQKVANTIEGDQMELKQSKLNHGQVLTAAKKEESIPKGPIKKQKAKAPTDQPKFKKSQNIRNKDGAASPEDSFGTDESDVEEKYSNPFKQIFEGKKQEVKNAIDEDKLQKLLKPKFDAILKKLELQQENISEKLTLQEKTIGELLKQQNEDFKDFLKDQEKENERIFNEINDVDKELHQSEKKLQESIQFMSNIIDSERIKNVKMRNNITFEIQREVNKMKEHGTETRQEFLRINSYIESSHQLLTTMLEDSMLGQMLQEQDIIDRKQISLFGIKKNQQILGQNQYAMSNNLTTEDKMATIDAGDVSGHRHRFWDLRNKDKDYNKVVLRPDKPGSNIRGADAIKNGRDQIRLTALNQSMALPAQDDKGQQAQLQSTANQRMLDDLRPLSPPITSKTNPATPNNAIGCLHQSQMNDATKPLAQRIATSQENPYNTLLMDRHCASCMTGFAPQVLNCIKLACLSYVNSPIKYSLNYGATRSLGKGVKDPVADKQNQVELSFTEITYIKEFLLIKCQGFLDAADSVLKNNPTLFGPRSMKINVDMGTPIRSNGNSEARIKQDQGPERKSVFQASRNTLDIEDFLRKEMGADDANSPILPSNPSQAESPIKFDKRFGDESPTSPNRKASPTKFGDESIWNTTLLNETMDKKDPGQGKSNTKLDAQAKKSGFQKPKLGTMDQEKMLKINKSSRVYSESKEATQSPTFSGNSRDPKKSGAGGGKHQDNQKNLKQSETQFSFIKHKKKQEARPKIDVGSLQTSPLDHRQAPKFKISILQEMISQKRNNKQSLTVNKYMEQLYLDQVELQEQRTNLSRQMKDKTYHLRLAQTQEKEFKRLNQVVDEAQEIMEQKQINDWNVNYRKLHSSFNTTRKKAAEDKFGGLSSSVHVPNMKKFSNILKNENQIMIKRQLALQNINKRPESVTDGKVVKKTLNLNNRGAATNDSSMRGGRNRTVLSITNQTQNTVRQGQPKNSIIGPGTNATPHSGTPCTPTQAADNFTDLSITNSVWPKTAKNTNTRYESTIENQILSLDGLNDGHPLAVASNSLQIDAGNLQNIIITEHDEYPTTNALSPTGGPTILNVRTKSAMEKQKSEKIGK